MSEDSVLILDPLPAPRSDRQHGTILAGTHVPVDALKANLEAVLRVWSEVFRNAEKDLPGGRLAHADLSLAVAVDGSIGVFGSKVGGEARGGITVRLTFGDRTATPQT